MVSNPTLHYNNYNKVNTNMDMNGNTVINVNNYTNTHYMVN